MNVLGVLLGLWLARCGFFESAYEWLLESKSFRQQMGIRELGSDFPVACKFKVEIGDKTYKTYCLINGLLYKDGKLVEFEDEKFYTIKDGVYKVKSREEVSR